MAGHCLCWGKAGLSRQVQKMTALIANWFVGAHVSEMLTEGELSRRLAR
jgi:hypothetical protein